MKKENREITIVQLSKNCSLAQDCTLCPGTTTGSTLWIVRNTNPLWEKVQWILVGGTLVEHVLSPTVVSLATSTQRVSNPPIAPPMTGRLSLSNGGMSKVLC